jgi:hypothetical protein
MTTWEARELAAWLRGLGNADHVTVAAANPEEVRLWLTEPNLMFTLADASAGVTMLDVYFDAEARPPRGSDDEDGLGHRVRLTLPQAELAAAVTEWEHALSAYPQR